MIRHVRRTFRRIIAMHLEEEIARFVIKYSVYFLSFKVYFLFIFFQFF